MTTKTKIRCAVCNKWEGHIIVGHLKEKHSKLSVEDYILQYDAPIASAHGFEVLKQHQPAAQGLAAPRTPKKVSDTFGLEPEKDEKKNGHRRFVNRTVDVFDQRHRLVPDMDPDYVFPEQSLRKLLIGLALPARNRVWLHGYAGTGKTQLVAQTCARLNRALSRINGDVALTRRHLIGDWVVRDGSTTFQYGILPTAMRRGDVLLIDEIDHFAPPTLAVLRSVMEDPSSLVILENGSEVVKAHPDFRIVATANTAGAGDETGLFVTSRALSVADRQRFSVWVEVNYLPASVEAAMMRQRFPKLDDEEVKRFYQVVKSIRDRHKAGELEESFSPRELINWLEKYFMVGDATEAAQMCFLDRYQSPAVKLAVSEIIKAAFDLSKPPTELPKGE